MREARRLVVAIGVALGVGVLGASLSTATARGPATCDPLLEMCLDDAAPWLSPQALTYRGPAAAGDLKVKWKQGRKRGKLKRVEVTSQDATTKTWRAILPPKLDPRTTTLDASTQEPPLQRSDTGEVRRLASKPKLRIGGRGTRRLARMRFRTRGAVQARIDMRLIARYPAERNETVKKWKRTKQFSASGAHSLAVRTDNVLRRCKRYARCILRATGVLNAVSYRVDRGGARRSVPTPKERPTGGLGFVPGNASSGGGGRRYSYAVYVEDGIQIDRKDFAAQIGRTLGDRRGWTRTGRVNFRQVSSSGSANTRLILASPSLVDRLCAPLQTRGYVSCTQGSSIVLNLNRWRYAVPHWTRSRLDYRRMLTNHEMGHRIGQGHRSCPGRGKKAPVMQQQTYGLQGCKANPWPLDSEARVARQVAPSARSSWPAPRTGAGWLE